MLARRTKIGRTLQGGEEPKKNEPMKMGKVPVSKQHAVVDGDVSGGADKEWGRKEDGIRWWKAIVASLESMNFIMYSLRST